METKLLLNGCDVYIRYWIVDAGLQVQPDMEQQHFKIRRFIYLSRDPKEVIKGSVEVFKKGDADRKSFQILEIRYSEINTKNVKPIVDMC